MRALTSCVLFSFSLLLAPVPALAADPVATPPLPTASDVKVARGNGNFNIDAVMHAPVPPDVAWEVLIDFDHMTSYQPGLAVSKVTERSGNRLLVRQQGIASFGPFSSGFESEREIRLSPKTEILSTNVGGTVKYLVSTMKLAPEPGGTLLRYHAEIDPGWLPPLLGPAAMRDSTAEGFAAMIREMQRRQAAKAGKP